MTIRRAPHRSNRKPATGLMNPPSSRPRDRTKTICVTVYPNSLGRGWMKKLNPKETKAMGRALRGNDNTTSHQP